MRRVVVLGGTGFFGAAAIELLRAKGVPALAASRGPGAQLKVDVESRPSLKSALRPLDVVLDAAGPFQKRSTSLIETALETGFDVIDLSDSLAYSERVADLRLRIEAAGIRVLTSCSSISTLSAAAIGWSQVEQPVGLSVLLRPASKATAHRATAEALLASVGAPIRVLHAGKLVERPGFRTSRRFDWSACGKRRRGFLSESADALHLPPIWPSLRRIEFYVDTAVPGSNLALSMAARSGAMRRALASLLPFGITICRLFGSRRGEILFEVEGADGAVVTVGLHARRHSYLIAVAPAVLATRAIAQGQFSPAGLVPPHQHVDSKELIEYAGRLGIDLITVRHGRAGA